MKNKPPTVWKHKEGELSLKEPLIMGILNATPDSFFDGGKYFGSRVAIERAQEIAEEGADILDIGGESTRPGSSPLSVEEELDRVLPIIEAVHNKINIPISIDTQKAEVAREAIKKGAVIINDISGFRHQAMQEIAAETGAGVVIMHMQGTPETMQKNPQYSDVITDISSYLERQAHKLMAQGVEKEKIVIDPGIGFGKTLEHNLTIFRHTRDLANSAYPVLIGASRKSFLKGILGPETDRFAGSLATHLYCILEGAHIVRVHDVAAMRESIDVIEAIRKTH